MRTGGLLSTGTFRPKALLLYLRDQVSDASARSFIEAVGGRGIFDDETRPVSEKLWFRALAEFERLAGKHAFDSLAKSCVHPETLGAWSRLLRGATSPEKVLMDLLQTSDGLPGESRWTKIEQRKRSFRLEASLPPDERPETHRRIIAALRAEVEAIPLLFGYPRARTRLGEVTADQFSLSLHISRPGTAFRLLTFAATGAFVTLLLLRFAYANAAVPELRAAPSYAVLSSALALAILLGLLHRDAERHSETVMQRIRILALEREASLRQSGHKEISRPHEEPIIAGQYRVGRQLGTGATGAVWEATRLTDGAKVAIKLLRTAVVHDVRASDRLRREAEALGLSWHPSVVEVFDSGLLPSGVGFLVMECLAGETLGELLDRGETLSLEDTRKLGLEATAALSAIHSAGVVHRDIKPENLFLVPHETDVFHLKIIDFGVAQVSWAETRLTRSGVRIGTPGYAPPEQETGAEVDGRSDLYGLGVVLRECITGRAPRGRVETASAHAAREIPEVWRPFLTTMTAEDKVDRFPTARDAREALLKIPSLDASDEGTRAS